MNTAIRICLGLIWACVPLAAIVWLAGWYSGAKTPPARRHGGDR